MSVVIVPFRLVGNAIVITARVNGRDAEFMLDTVPAISAWPVFCGTDFQRLDLEVTTPNRVSADIAFGDVTFQSEEAAVDFRIYGPSLIGLPFFMAKTKELVINFERMELCFRSEDGEEPMVVAKPRPKAPRTPRVKVAA